MKIYYSNLAALKPENFKFPKVGILISFFGLKKIQVPNFCDSLFLDCGAFSAYRKNINIDVNDYIHFLKEEKDAFDIYASLDNIADEKESIDNYNKMVEVGLNPIPCFHFGENIETLDFYIDKTDYVALGGIAKKGKRDRVNFLDRIFNRYPDFKFHGFGINSRVILKSFPWFSVDSSSAHLFSRFGGVFTPFGDFKINPNVRRKKVEVNMKSFTDRDNIFYYTNELNWMNNKKLYAQVKEWCSTKVDFNLLQRGDKVGTEARSFLNVSYMEEML